MENVILIRRLRKARLRVEFEFDEDQRLLQQSVRETLAKTRALPEEELWATYTELGWLEAPPVELAIVLDELGYVADPTPFLATATWFAPLAGRLPAGSGAGVFDGAGRFVLDADRADEVALLTSKGVQVVSGAEIDAERIVAFDSRLHLAHVRADGHQLAAGVPDLALMGLAATTVGACRRILDLVVTHVKQRHQFGVPIGSFQAVKHKAAAGDCQQVVYRNGFQLFGAMGFTWENELHIYLKRALAGDLLLGSATVHKKALLALGAEAASATPGGTTPPNPPEKVTV